MLSESRERMDMSLVQVIWNDFLAFLAVIFPPILWVVFGFFTFKDGGEFPIKLLFVGIAITFACFVILIWRIMFFRSLFADEQEVQATISDVMFFRDRGRVSYVFLYNGQKVIASSAVMKTKRTKALNIGDIVSVLVDRNNPKQAVIRSLYSREG